MVFCKNGCILIVIERIGIPRDQHIFLVNNEIYASLIDRRSKVNNNWTDPNGRGKMGFVFNFYLEEKPGQKKKSTR